MAEALACLPTQLHWLGLGGCSNLLNDVLLNLYSTNICVAPTAMLLGAKGNIRLTFVSVWRGGLFWITVQLPLSWLRS